MKISKAGLFTALTVLCLVGALAYTQRVEIAEQFRAWQQPSVPDPVGFEEFSERDSDSDDEEVDEPDDGELTDDEEPVNTADDEEASPEEPEDTDTTQVDDPATDDVDDTNTQPSDSEEVDSNDVTDDTAESDLPSEVNLAVPFTAQAPHGDWSPPFKEACEEASVYMVHAYYNNVPEENIDPDRAEEDLLKIVEFQERIFGFYEDTTVQQTSIFAEQFYGFSRVEEVTNPTVEQIKRHVAEGRPVIVPAAGRELNNQYYTPPGPYYHMLVIRGYTDDGFITNDPGTRRGKAYVYGFDRLMQSIHDFDEEDMQQGRQVVLVIYPEE